MASSEPLNSSWAWRCCRGAARSPRSPAVVWWRYRSQEFRVNVNSRWCAARRIDRMRRTRFWRWHKRKPERQCKSTNTEDTDTNGGPRFSFYWICGSLFVSVFSVLVLFLEPADVRQPARDAADLVEIIEQ